MNGGSSIGGWRAAQAGTGADLALPLELDPEAILPLDEPAPREGGGIAAPAAALLAVLAWLGGALWLARDTLPLMAVPALVEFVAALAVPVALAGIGWLLLRGSSRAEARGFARTAATMRAEVAGLERSIATLSAAVDTNRIKLADQAEALAAIGGEAADRLASVGQGFAIEIAQANRHAAALGAATGEAQAGLGVLLATLPRARAETLDAADALDRVARAADDHAMALDARLQALSDQGAAAERVAEGAAARLAEQTARVGAAGNAAAARIADATRTAGDAVEGMLARAGAGVAAAGHDLDAHGRAMADALAQHQVTLDGAARDAAEALAARIEVIELVAERLARRLEEQGGASERLVGGLEAGVGRVSGQLDRLHEQGVERTGRLAAAITALGGSAEAMTDALRTGEETAARAIGTAEALLTALDAAAREVDETLPEALARLDARVAASGRVVAQTKPELLALVTAAESTSDAISGLADVIAGQRGALDDVSQRLLATLDEARGRADALGAGVEGSVVRANRFADEAAPRLLDALLRVRDTADAAADHARETLGRVIPEAADRLESASAAAVERAAGAAVAERIAAIGQAADAAVAAASGAATRLGDRLRAIDDSAALVESRLEDARAAREEAERDSFARRSGQLIDAMHSAAIDITKSFAPDVADSAWAAYLKGDRGVFTRRAVRLLDAGEAREIARLYDEQPEFREQVNRYIHDFEAMLRAILAQREGSPLGVTLLSSDMGKLYVALAQAIERLR